MTYRGGLKGFFVGMRGLWARKELALFTSLIAVRIGANKFASLQCKQDEKHFQDLIQLQLVRDITNKKLGHTKKTLRDEKFTLAEEEDC